MKEAETMDSICVDDEMMQFQVTCSIQERWKNAFIDEAATIKAVLDTKGLAGSKFHDLVDGTFLTQFKAVDKIRENLPDGYAFPYKPSLMQAYV